MARYLLTCECGASVPVEAGQAGGQVNCTCGRPLDVPPLRHLRHLPAAAPTQAERAQTGSRWSVRHGIATLCLLVAGVLAAVAAWSRFNEPVVPEFNPAAHTGHMENQIDALTPEQAWQVWVYQYQPLAEVGFAPLENRQEPAIRAYIENQRFFQRAVLIAAGVCAAIALLAIVWPRSQTRRQGDKETRRG
jgi:hypothetical protein